MASPSNLRQIIKSKRSKASGEQAEAKALTYLTQQGLSLLVTNYQCKLGEIDLIMKDENSIVFVEVRFRKSSTFGGAAASVDQRKQGKLRRSAEYYLQQNTLSNYASRFDVIAITGDDWQWIRGAF